MSYIFGDCELDVERCELWRAGATVTVEPKVFKALAHLNVHRDRVVTKDELLERFWPGTFVSESALTRCMTKVRHAVRDDRLSQRVIKLVDGRRLQAQTLSYGQAMPYHTVIPLIRALLELPDHSPVQHRRQHLRARLAAVHPSLADDAALLGQLLGVSHEGNQGPALPPEAQKRRLQQTCLHVFAQQAVAQPRCLLIEDLHWLDGSSREFLDLLVASLARLPILLVGTARPGVHDAWGAHTYVHRLVVEPLSDEHTDSLVDDYFRPHEAAVALKTLIRERTAGNPFFVEEMLHTLQAHELTVLQDDLCVLKPGVHLGIPASVHGVLAARVDRLPAEEKRLLQAAAVIGMEIPCPILRAIADLPDNVPVGISSG